MNAINVTRLAVLSAGICGLSGATVPVQAQLPLAAIVVEHMEAVQRELGIMRNIFAAALNDNGRNSGSRRFRLGPPEALYLMDQGMVFTFHLNGSGGVYIGGNQIVVAPMPAPQVFLDGDFDYDFDFDFDFDFDDGGGFTAMREQQQAYQEELRTMNEQMRDGQLELRDMQREIRDLQREERDGEVDNAEKIAEVQARIDHLMQEMQNHAASMQQLQQEYQDEQLAAFEAARAEQTSMIFTTLCDYGGTLRSLESEDHVSIVLNNYADGLTQVNVFELADIANCSSVDELRQAGTTYLLETRGF